MGGKKGADTLVKLKGRLDVHLSIAYIRIMPQPFRSVYVAFDPHPSSKGASTHIDQMCRVLSETHGPTLLLTLPGTHEPIRTDTLTQWTFESDETNLLKKASSFSARCTRLCKMVVGAVAHAAPGQ